MSTEPTKKPDPIPPKCPHCKKEMPMLGLFAYQIDPLIIPILMCPWCHVLLHIHVTVPTSAVAPTSAPQSELWKPS
jgi:hypothetical protein